MSMSYLFSLDCPFPTQMDNFDISKENLDLDYTEGTRRDYLEYIFSLI